jgi:glutamate-ammonia-ligase adenylyltransferase
MGRRLTEHLLAFLPDELRERFQTLLAMALGAAPDPEGALNALLHLAEAASNPAALLSYLADDPATLEALLVVLSGSHFAARTLTLHPEYLPLLAERHRLAQPKGLSQLRTELSDTLAPFRTLASQLDALRRFRRREMVRLIAADLLGLMDVPTVTRELSDLAEALVNAVVALMPPQNFRPLVVAFGKLGASELNYSSDIDLAIFHDGDSLAAERWVRKFVAALTEVTDYGRLYRVDLRLRPYGATGPLTLPLEAAFAYYETHAEPTERLALLKARPMAGDEGLAQRFETFRHAFVFGEPLQAEELAWLLRVKARTEATFAADGAVKHGLGGIRDVEMTAQFLQLAFAPTFPDLSVRDTLTALERLHRHDLLTADEFATLKDSYLFLRRLEHLLQIAEDLPMQTLPTDERELNRLARCLHLPDGKELLREFERRTQGVRTVYESVTAELAKALGVSEQTSVLLSIVSGLDADATAMQGYGFAQPHEAQRRLFRLVHGETTSVLRWRERVRILRVLPSVLDAIARTPDPDAALMRLEGLIAGMGPRPSVLDSLSTNPLALRAIALVASLSEPLCQLAQRHPETLEVWLAGVTPPLPTAKQIRSAVEAALRSLPSVSDRRAVMNLLRRLKGRFALHLGLLHLCRLADAEVVGQTLAHLADVLTDAALFALNASSTLALLALGGWGSGELHFGSDLDVAFVHEGDQQTCEHQVRQLRSLLADATEEGIAYRLDLRLRPTGQEGALSSDLDTWRDFSEGRFEAWMALAWTRLRPAAGNWQLGQSVARFVKWRLYTRGLDESHWAELTHLLARIRKEHRPPREVLDLKHSDGTLWDIELAVAEAQLREGQSDPALRTPSLAQALRALAEREEIWRQRLATYRWLRQLRLWLSWVMPEAPPRFVRGDKAEKLLAWLDANEAPLTQSALVPVDEAVERFQRRWRERFPPP